MRRWWWWWMGLLAVLAFDVWLRLHTVGPEVRERLGIDPYFATGRASEPLDCDEAVYAYIGKRIVAGDVMYRDLTENKPPLGYWLYAAAVALGGFHELTIRLLPLPFVLATIGLVAWIGRRLRGPATGLLAAFTFAVVSADPFVFGNGANMEHMINFLATAALSAFLAGWDRPGRGWIFAAGACLGGACLVKQVAVLHLVVFGAACLFRRTDGLAGRRVLDRGLDLAALAGGFLVVVGLAAAVLVMQGAGRQAYEDVFRYGRALATEVPAPPNAPSRLIRWFTGNADPEGNLPWPFGRTNYLVWWGCGAWPLWLAAAVATPWLALGRGAAAPRRIVAAWTLSAWVQVAMPGLFWQHYYMLPLPGLCLAASVMLGDLVEASRSRRLAPIVLSGLTGLAFAAVFVIQAREYLGVSPEELTIRDKGGRQWIVLRDLGRDLGRRTRGWDRPRLFVWGWQSPLFFYSGLDGVTPQLFADDFIRYFAGSSHPIARPRIERTMHDLGETPPALIFCGYAPFPELQAFLTEHYIPSGLVPQTPDGRGMWVEKSRYGAFETARVRLGPEPPRRGRRPLRIERAAVP